MGQSKERYTLTTWVGGWMGYTCPRCGREGVYAGTLGHGCTDCDNYFSHGLRDPLTLGEE